METSPVISGQQAPEKSQKDVSQYFEVIPDFAAFLDTEGSSLEFPIKISLLEKSAQTKVHAVRNYVQEGLLCCSEQTPI